jgi:hypothetical protein
MKFVLTFHGQIEVESEKEDIALEVALHSINVNPYKYIDINERDE